jgi:hypothetical protein
LVNDLVVLGNMSSTGNDFQNQNALFIEHIEKKKKAGGRHTVITNHNLIEVAVYFAVRKCIAATWLNDRDQFLYPNEKWETDKEFQHDCLTYTLFNNNIQAKFGINHWIPFTENEVNARQEFESNFMTDFILGKLKKENSTNMFEKVEKTKRIKLEFSTEAKAVFASGKALWVYYHQEINKIPLANLPNKAVDAAFYDIRNYFQGRNADRMNSKSTDEVYTKLLADLKDSLAILAKKIEPKVYEYGFLK